MVVSRDQRTPGVTGRDSVTSALAAERPCTKAVILARGLGTRTREADDGVSLAPGQAAAAELGVKGMIPIGRPFLDYVLNAPADGGFTGACLVVAPNHAEVRDHYTKRTVPKRLRLTFAVQTAAIGTADAVFAAQERTLGEPFVVLNADNYYPAESLARLRLVNGPAAMADAPVLDLSRRSDIPRVAALLANTEVSL